VPSVTWTFPARPENVTYVRQSASDFARAHGVPDPPLSDVRLALSEAVTNAVLHAFRDRPEPGTVTVAISVPDGVDRVDVLVADDGMGMSRRPDSPGIGLGLPLIRRLASELDHGPAPGGGTELRMSFRFDGA
jgi:anti-sigma regulatory factor (Ser/Thr protein kinase)